MRNHSFRNSENADSFVQNQFWHQTQIFEKLDNGNILMKITCGINRELVGWIFQWMSNAKVLKPNILANMVADKLVETAQLYKENSPIISNNSFRPD